MQETKTWVWSLSREDPLEKGMITHSSILAWRIPWIQEPGRLQSMTSHRVGHDWVTNTFAFIFDFLWSIIFTFSFEILIWALSLVSLDESSKWFTYFIYLFKEPAFRFTDPLHCFLSPSVSHSCPLHLPRRPCSSSRYMWPSLLWSHCFFPCAHFPSAHRILRPPGVEFLFPPILWYSCV